MEGLMFKQDGQSLKSVIWTGFRYVSLAHGKTAPHPPAMMEFLAGILFQEEGLAGLNYQDRIKALLARGRPNPAG